MTCPLVSPWSSRHSTTMSSGHAIEVGRGVMGCGCDVDGERRTDGMGRRVKKKRQMKRLELLICRVQSANEIWHFWSRARYITPRIAPRLAEVATSEPKTYLIPPVGDSDSLVNHLIINDHLQVQFKQFRDSPFKTAPCISIKPK